MTVDGNLVLLHDADVNRTTDGHGSLSSMTLAEVKKLDAGTWFDREFKGTVIPTLDEVLDWSRNRLALLIELKNYPQRDVAFINQLAATILRNDAAHFSIPSSFDHPTLSELHRRFPEWTLAMILPCRLSDPVHAARAAGATLHFNGTRVRGHERAHSPRRRYFSPNDPQIARAWRGVSRNGT